MTWPKNWHLLRKSSTSISAAYCISVNFWFRFWWRSEFELQHGFNLFHFLWEQRQKLSKISDRIGTTWSHVKIKASQCLPLEHVKKDLRESVSCISLFPIIKPSLSEPDHLNFRSSLIDPIISILLVNAPTIWLYHNHSSSDLYPHKFLLPMIVL